MILLATTGVTGSGAAPVFEITQFVTRAGRKRLAKIDKNSLVLNPVPPGVDRTALMRNGSARLFFC